MSHSFPSIRERGFTLIEGLVVVLVVGLLIALILPAVQSSREASRRAECGNRLRQIGLALNAHHAVHQAYPAAIVPNGRIAGKPAALAPVSAHALLLGHLEQVELSRQLETGLGRTGPPFPAAAHPKNRTARSTTLAVFLCPSDRGAAEAGAPGNSYRACNGPYPHEFEGAPGHGGGGAFPGFRATASAEFTDGLGATVGFSERSRGSGNPRSFDRKRDYWLTLLSNTMIHYSNDEILNICAFMTDQPSLFSWRPGSWWIEGNYPHTSYNHVAPPNWTGPDCSADGEGMAGGVMTARGNHPGGVNVLVMDGSVRFVTNSIALAVWRALATRAGGEPVELP